MAALLMRTPATCSAMQASAEAGRVRTLVSGLLQVGPWGMHCFAQAALCCMC